MIIGVAGPYSAPTAAEKQANLDKLNSVAATLLQMGHVPIIGVNAALPVVNAATLADPYEGIMSISMAVMQCCEALLIIAESPGANRERDSFTARGLPVYNNLSEIPAAH